MLFLIVGLGSMGKRRIRNLQFLGHKEIIGFDPREDRRKEAENEYKIKTFGDFESALSQKPDALIISTPPDFHIQYATEAVKRNIHFFMEVTVDECIDDLVKLCKGKKIIAAPSSTFRFKQSIKKVKELLDSGALGKPIAFNYHMGQYLPDWHPWENIKSFYVGKRKTGACREMFCFETGWLTWLFGKVGLISCVKGKFSNLEADIDDVYAMIYKFDSNIVGTFLLDVVSRVPYRTLKIFCEEGVIIWELDKVSVYSAKDKKWKEYGDSETLGQKAYWVKDDMYVEEIRHFIAAIEGKEKYSYSLEEERDNYLLLLNAERSSDKRIHVKSK